MTLEWHYKHVKCVSNFQYLTPKVVSRQPWAPDADLDEKLSRCGYSPSNRGCVVNFRLLENGYLVNVHTCICNVTNIFHGHICTIFGIANRFYLPWNLVGFFSFRLPSLCMLIDVIGVKCRLDVDIRYSHTISFCGGFLFSVSFICPRIFQLSQITVLNESNKLDHKVESHTSRFRGFCLRIVILSANWKSHQSVDCKTKINFK